MRNQTLTINGQEEPRMFTLPDATGYTSPWINLLDDAPNSAAKSQTILNNIALTACPACEDGCDFLECSCPL